MDKTDTALIAALRRDARQSLSQLSATLGVTRATVRARLDHRVAHPGHDLAPTVGRRLAAVVALERRVAADRRVAAAPQQTADDGDLHRDVEVLSKPRSVTFEDRGDRVGGGLDRAVMAGLGKADRDGRTVLVALVVEEAAGGREGQVGRGGVGERTGDPERGDADVDQRGESGRGRRRSS